MKKFKGLDYILNDETGYYHIYLRRIDYLICRYEPDTKKFRFKDEMFSLDVQDLQDLIAFSSWKNK